MNASFFLTLFVVLSLGLLTGRADGAEAPAWVESFFATHCNRCHDESKQKGEFRLDTLSRDFDKGGSAMHWGDVMVRISSQEMPPPKEPQPEVAEAARVVEWIAARLKEGEAARLAQRERVSFHKLTREEYAATMRDLLGVFYDATCPTGLPQEGTWQGFERIGSVLSLSPAHVEKYFSAAEMVLTEALPEKEPPKFLKRWDVADLRGGINRDELKKKGLFDKLRIDVWPGGTLNGHPGSIATLRVPVSGSYRVRLQCSGLKPPRGRAPHFTLYSLEADRMLFEQDVIAPEDKPVTLEFSIPLVAGENHFRLNNDVPGPTNLERAGRTHPRPLFFSIKEGRPPWQTKLTDEAGQAILPFLIVDWMEFEGPILPSWPTPALLAYLPAGATSLAQARESLTRFAEAAFRRPALPPEVDRWVQLVEAELKTGEPYAAALKTAMVAVLCSKDFLYLVEGSLDSSSPQLTGWELASRLSYFLWGTMPDASLRDAARTGHLHTRDSLRAQVKRMLQDPRHLQFTEAFPRQWLQLRHVGMFPPDKKLYPAYDAYLEKSMVQETTEFFREVLEKNLTLREFLLSDWTLLNARLAEHYQITGVSSDQFQRVALRPEDRRGGLLTQASILSLTSDGTRHRPVHRGKWMLETIIGRPPPPPPANVKPIETAATNVPKSTLRMKLAAHVSQESCASCHSHIDPLGLAFDHFDAIGSWRTEEVVRDGSGGNPPVDASGRLPDGRTFSDEAGLKQLLLGDIDKFNSVFIEKLATFALRRAMSVDDRAALAAIAKKSRDADYKLQTLVEELVLSDLFQKR